MVFHENGFELLENAVDLDAVDAIKRELASFEPATLSGGLRHAEKKLDSVYRLTHDQRLLDQAKKYLPGEPTLVRAIAFNKTLERNWLVPWHQDKTVAVSSKFSAPGWGPWSWKEGVLHVQPPLSVLEQMMTFRIHLDEANEGNGCLKVIPKSHRKGILSQPSIRNHVKNGSIFVCNAPAASALAMRPHLLHSSSKTTSQMPRRVIHLEYCCFPLPAGASWA